MLTNFCDETNLSCQCSLLLLFLLFRRQQRCQQQPCLGAPGGNEASDVMRSSCIQTPPLRTLFPRSTAIMSDRHVTAGSHKAYCSIFRNEGALVSSLLPRIVCWMACKQWIGRQPGPAEKDLAGNRTRKLQLLWMDIVYSTAHGNK